MIDRRDAVFNVRQELRLIPQREPRYIVGPAVPKPGCQLPGTLHRNFVHRGVHTKLHIEHETQNAKIRFMGIRTRDDVTTLSAGIQFHTIGLNPHAQTVLASGPSFPTSLRHRAVHLLEAPLSHESAPQTAEPDGAVSP